MITETENLLETIIYLLLLSPLLIGASWRIARLFVEDKITEGIRDFVWRRFPVSQVYYRTKHVNAPEDHTFGTIAKLKSFPFRGRNVMAFDVPGEDETQWIPVDSDGKPIDVETKIGYLFTCMDCMPVYTSALVVFGFFYFTPGIAVATQAVIFLATALAVSVLESRVG